MDIRHLTDNYAVSPQIAADDMAAIKNAGFTMVIDNRPDAEVPPPFWAEAMRVAADAQGLAFVVNPIDSRGLSMSEVNAQKDAIAAATGPVLAYCASGTRSSIAWAFANAGLVLVTSPSTFCPFLSTPL